MKTDVIIVGGGHAGVEAALAARRVGCSVILVTLDSGAIGRMSCNPSIGGLAKGQLAREVDALGGLMGVAADHAAMQFRMLNTSKGPAVQSPRAQVDKDAYAAFVRATVEGASGLTVVQGQVAAVSEGGGKVAGVELVDGSHLPAHAVVLTTGTFLRGLMHVGDRSSAGGRVGEAPAAALSASLSGLGLDLVRLKTGTPPRVSAKSVDLPGLESHTGHPDDGRFSYGTPPPADRQSVPTWRTATSAQTHDLVREKLHLSPYGRGALDSVGPRYCPSLEDKIVRFADKDEHRVFVEQETLHGDSLYLNGLSNCLPAEVQQQLVRSLPGFASARMLRPGYAVEYDAVPACQLRPSLECRALSGLFLAGQINGTSGYEEAAAQGLMAGLNAARTVQGLPTVSLGRHEAYVGVLIDDLTTLSPVEPYRMFTSRAEFRLVLRQDNADRRLSDHAFAWGLIDGAVHEAHLRRETAISKARSAMGDNASPLRRRLRSGDSWSEVSDSTPRLAKLELPADWGLQVELDERYEGYVRRQARMVAKLERLASVPLPDDLDYALLEALRPEAREVLARARPADLGQASRLAGVTPADLSLLALSRSAAKTA
ncbi:MAG: tRNA uridine 5-carboxymethylaminomethyl modification enzyme [Pseudohongiellaceae bacterium]|jgi:tRNA uridine 5-carboxymethylaminomethyl modification enzyme